MVTFDPVSDAKVTCTLPLGLAPISTSPEMKPGQLCVVSGKAVDAALAATPAGCLAIASEVALIGAQIPTPPSTNPVGQLIPGCAPVVVTDVRSLTFPSNS
jgi:hypothetical protein